MDLTNISDILECVLHVELLTVNSCRMYWIYARMFDGFTICEKSSDQLKVWDGWLNDLIVSKKSINLSQV